MLPITSELKPSCFRVTIKGKRRGKMTAIFIVCIVIVIIVLLLSILTTSKAYSYKHIVDPLENNPHLNQEDEQDKTQS
jgi:flagellar basal body-associated protein FliL